MSRSKSSKGSLLNKSFS